MWQKLNNLSNRFGNTIRIPTRLGYTAMNTVTDSVDTLVAMPKDALDVIQYTSHEIKNILSSAWTTWKRYQRVWNIILSPFVAMWAAVEWAVKTVVTPSVNWVVNTRNTWKNTVKNTWRSTFGRIFSKKPVSDFSYDKLKTANVIQKDKNRFSKRRFGRKSMWWNKWKKEEWEPKSQDNAWKVAATATVAATAWATVSNATNFKEYEKMKAQIEWMKNDMENLKKQKDELEKQLAKALEMKKENSNWKPEKVDTKTEWKAWNKWNKEEKGWEDSDKKENSSWKSEKIENAESKTEWKAWDKWDKEEKAWEDSEKKTDSKSNEKKWKWADKSETKEEKKAEDSIKESEEKKDETLDKDSKRKWLDEAKNLVENSICWQKILDWLSENYKDFWVIFDDSTSSWKHDNENHVIIVWTKLPKDMNSLAPFNWEEKDPVYQKRHVLLHELAHCTVTSYKNKIPEIQKWLDTIEKYIDKDHDGRTLSLLSYKNDTYKTNKDKAKEDFVEMLALAMNWKWNACKKYMDLLSDDEHKEFREKNGLATISKKDAETLGKACRAVVKFYKSKKTS